MRCAAGHEPVSQSYTKTTRQCKVSFNCNYCVGCPYQGQCRPKIDGWNATFITSKNASNRAKSQRYMQSEEFSNYAKLRNGVETVPANIRKNYRLDKLPRGKQRAKFFFGSKIAALNFRKLFGFRKGLVNYAQNPIFGYRNTNLGCSNHLDMVMRSATSHITKTIGKSTGKGNRGAASGSTTGGPRIGGGPSGVHNAAGHTASYQAYRASQQQNTSQGADGQGFVSQRESVQSGGAQTATQEHFSNSSTQNSSSIRQTAFRGAEARKSSVPSGMRRAPAYVTSVDRVSPSSAQTPAAGYDTSGNKTTSTVREQSNVTASIRTANSAQHSLSGNASQHEPAGRSPAPISGVCRLTGKRWKVFSTDFASTPCRKRSTMSVRWHWIHRQDLKRPVETVAAKISPARHSSSCAENWCGSTKSNANSALPHSRTARLL